MSALAIGDLSVLLAIPVIGAGALVFISRRRMEKLFSIALLASGVNFLWSLIIFDRFDANSGEMQLLERVPWIPAFGIEYSVGIDGISIFLVLLTTLLMPIAILA
jgi:NADH-quinone oxidoreductase subunit M